MLQVATIRENKANIIAGLEKRGLENAAQLIEEVIALDDQRKANQGKHDDMLAESKTISKQIGLLMKEGKKDEAEDAKRKSAELKAESKKVGEEQAKIENKLTELLYNIPNVPNASVPAGNTEDDNEVVEERGSAPELPEDALPHWDLIKKYDIIDFEMGVKVTGAGFPFYKGQGARLQRALVNFFLDEATKIGYNEVQPPIVINEASGYGTGQLPDKDGQMYHIQNEDFYLIPTAEVPITNMYRDTILDQNDFPIKNVGYTPCFRREAGSWGAHVRGLNRLHQFDKVEIVQIQDPGKSYDTLQEMCNYVKGLLEKLGLQYRMLNLCAGDLGFTSAQTFDMEVYAAAQKKWLEVSSVSNFEAYQANRLMLRFKDEHNKKQLCHTLNGSALALPRIIAAILENNQTPEGIKVPDVLVPYTGFDMIR
ncbi:MAG: serine--tRNA ligase [Fulvivirga sp.]|nr:serine--tRNA ligase [Fulvivirga sp.]